MTVTDERLDQIARNLLAYEISEACADPQYQKGALYGALDGYDRMDGIEQDELLARFGAALRRVKAELIQEGNGYYGAQNHHLHVQVEPGTAQARADERAKILAVLSDAELAHTSGPDVLPAGEVFRLCRDALIQLVRDDG